MMREEEEKLVYKDETGKYHCQGQLVYKEPEEVVYDDSYRMSIPDLFKKHKPRTMPQMQAILNENGYMGRSKVRRLYKDSCYPLNDYLIEVELIWGKVKYNWPCGGTYSLDFYRVDRGKRDVALPANASAIVEAMYKYFTVGSHSINRKLGIPIADVELVVSHLEEVGIIRGGDLKIVHDLELKEVIGNLLTL